MAQEWITRFTHQTLQVLHKDLQTDVVRENRLAGRTAACTVQTTGHVRCRWVQLGEEEAGLGAALIADDVPARA